jgi:hypothetical protein
MQSTTKASVDMNPDRIVRIRFSGRSCDTHFASHVNIAHDAQRWRSIPNGS